MALSELDYRRQLWESLWSLGYSEDFLRGININDPATWTGGGNVNTSNPNDKFYAHLVSLGVKSSDLQTATKMSEWRNDDKDYQTRIASYLKDVLGWKSTDAVYQRAIALAQTDSTSPGGSISTSGSKFSEAHVMQALKEFLSPAAFTQMTIKTGTTSYLTTPVGQGVPAWNPLRTDNPNPNAGKIGPPAPAGTPGAQPQVSGTGADNADYSGDPATWSPTKVRALQGYLNSQGAKLAVDGVYGPQTKAAHQANKTAVASGTATGAGGTAGAGGTTTTTGSGGVTIPANMSPAELKSAASTKWGFWSWMLDHPVIGPLLIQATKEGWGEGELVAKIRDTDWWKTTTDTQRSWQKLNAEDKATATKKVDDQTTEISREADRMGVTLSYGRMRDISEQALSQGWQPWQIKSALAAEFHYDPKGDLKGTLGNTTVDVKKMAKDYLVPMDDQTLEKWVRQVSSGEQTEDSFRSYLITQAKSMFPHLSGALDTGVTVAQYIEPYKAYAAQRLNIPATTIDFTDPKWMKAIYQIDPKTGDRTAMSLTEWDKEIRTNPVYGYDKTPEAVNTATQLSTQLLKRFGFIG